MRDERADRIKGAATTWAWDEYVPFNDVTMLAGRDGAAKSLFACHLIAAWTRGQLTRKKERVYVAMAEATADAGIVPRLEVAGADMSRVTINLEPKRIRFPGSAPDLAQRVAASKSRIVIIDPLDSFIRNAARGRDGIDELADMARENDWAVFVVHHFNRKIDGKHLLNAIGGGRGLLAATRSIFAWGLVVDRATDMGREPRLYGLIQLKNTHAELQDPELYAARRVENPYDRHHALMRLESVGPYPLTGEHLFPKKHGGGGGTKIERARDLILEVLDEREEIDAQDLEKLVLKDGISKRTFETARSRLRDEGLIENVPPKRAGLPWRWRAVAPVSDA